MNARLQVVRELDIIVPVLLDEKADWEAQRDALNTVRAMVTSGAAEWPSFTPKLLPTVHRLAKLVRAGVRL